MNILITGGFNAALIQKKEADIIDFSSVLWYNKIRRDNMPKKLYAALSEIPTKVS